MQQHLGAIGGETTGVKYDSRKRRFIFRTDFHAFVHANSIKRRREKIKTFRIEEGETQRQASDITTQTIHRQAETFNENNKKMFVARVYGKVMDGEKKTKIKKK